MNRTKIIIIAALGLFAIGIIFLFMRSGNKTEKKEDVSLSADVPKEFTHDEMMKTKENQNYQNTGSQTNEGTIESNYQSKDEAEIRAIQNQIKSNNRPSEEVSPDYTEGYVSTPPKKKKQAKPRKEQQEEKNEDIVEAIPKEVKVKQEIKPSRFFSATKGKQISSNSIRAVVHGDQIVGDGSTLKMRLIQDAFSENQELIPKNTFVYGTVTVSEERVRVKITSVRVKNNILKLEKQVYDRDAIEGIYAPGSIKSEIRSETTNEAISSVNPTSADGLIQAGANTILQAGKSVLSRSTKKVRILIKTNYEIYMR